MSGLTSPGVGLQDGSVSSPSLKFSNDGDTGLYRIGNNTIGFTAGGQRVGEIGPGYGGFTGNVIQVQSTTKTDTFFTASSSYVEITGLSLNITPKNASNRIILIGNLSVGFGTATILRFRFTKNNTPIGIGDTAGSRTSATSAVYTGNADTVSHISSVNLVFYDSVVGTTNTITYKIECSTPSIGLYINRNQSDGDNSGVSRTISTITAMEIQQ